MKTGEAFLHACIAATLTLAGCGSGGGSSTGNGNGGGGGGGGGGGAQPLRCTELAGKTIGDATVQSSGETTVAGVSACQANARTGNINFQVTIPCDWNGKLLYIGGGGFNGVIGAPTASWSPGMLGDTNCSGGTQGYAIVASDGGHQGDVFKASWALNNDTARDDNAFRAVHTVQAAAREIVARHKGTAVSKAYFEGCSDGGRQALIAAQRYPDDFDGIVARAPSVDPSGSIVAWNRIVRRLAAPGGALPAAKLDLLANAELATCDAADGLADGIIGNPSTCSFDTATLRCPGANTGDCLTDSELETLALIRAPTSLPHAQVDGVTTFPGYPIGHENEYLGVRLWMTEGVPPDPPFLFQVQEQFLRYLIADDPNLDTMTVDINAQVAGLERESRRMDATNADLGPFFASGGKLIVWHGWNDYALPVALATDYVERVRSATGAQADDALRYYTAPGVLHCEWGPGADNVDLVTPLDAWVTNGTAPGTLTARRYPLKQDGKPDFDAGPLLSRPLCRHPEYPHYNGAGDTTDAASFSCLVP